jgi:16S rRNA (cytidine1402-2'-O)-methyltransferase
MRDENQDRIGRLAKAQVSERGLKVSIGKAGILYIVATPIGHLGDMTARALEVLGQVDVVAAEDTRRSGQLLRHFGIATPCLSLHDHNERELTPRLIERLRRGDAVALVSDAGTPLISDPGFHLVRAAHDAGIRVVPVPGPSALVAALSVSGLPSDRFVFEGFLPARAAPRRERLEQLRDEVRTLVFYEAPHRALATLAAMVDVFGAEREAACAREITKLHETIMRDTLGGLLDRAQRDPMQQKGEIVIAIHGADSSAAVDEADACRMLGILLEELPLKQAAALAAKLSGVGKNRLYELGLTLRRRQ